MSTLVSVLGGGAAFLTATANLPQVVKCFRTGRSGDLSLKMLLALATGFVLWVSYGLLRGDAIVAGANALSLVLVAILLWFKFREGRGRRRKGCT